MMLARHRRQLVLIAVSVLSLFLLIIHFQRGTLSGLFEKVKYTQHDGSHDPAIAFTTVSSTPSTDQSTPTPIPGSPQQIPSLGDTDESSGNFSALRSLCSTTQWTPGLWLHCHSTCGPSRTSVCGGLNNARNRIQTCIRYAIDAGANLILPTVTTRSEKHLEDTGAGIAMCANTFWDMNHLKSELQNYCPQMKLQFCDDRAGINKVLKAPHRGFDQPPHQIGSFSKLVHETLTKHHVTPADMLDEPVIINFADSLLGWSYRQSNELLTIRKDLYKILPYNRDLLKISYEILEHPELQDGEFVGVHLRGESDWPPDFGSATDQMRLYQLEITQIPNIKTIYVSCGSRSVISQFRSILEPLGYIVHSKWTILSSSPSILSIVDNLPFDQKAIVEYETLVHSRYFLGPAMSSMSAIIAYERTVGEEWDFFERYVFPGSVRDEETRWRNYATTPALLGDERTKLMVVNNFDIMDNFP